MVLICQRMNSKDKVGQKRKEDRGNYLSIKMHHILFTFHFLFPINRTPPSKLELICKSCWGGADPCTLHIAHCTMHIVHCTLHIAHCTMHIAHCTLHIVHCAVHSAHLAGCQISEEHPGPGDLHFFQTPLRSVKKNVSSSECQKKRTNIANCYE